MENMSKLYMILQVVGSTKLNIKGIVHAEQAYRGILDCFSKTYREAGVRGLYRGGGRY